jgi:cytoskeletal protein RodZ
MKRIIAALTVAALICMAIVFAACTGTDCGGNRDNEKPTQSPAETGSPTADTTEAPDNTEASASETAVQTPSAETTESPDNTDISTANTPAPTPTADESDSPDETEGGSAAIDDGGDIIITVPTGQTPGGIGGNP